MNERQRKKFEDYAESIGLRVEKVGSARQFTPWKMGGVAATYFRLEPEKTYRTYSAACQDEAERAQGLVKDAKRALEAWDSTVLPSGHDGMMQERMECLRAALLDFKGDAK